LAPGQALAAGGITVSPTNPAAGDSVTATGSYTTECYSGISNNAPQITFTFEIENSHGTYSAVSTSSAGTGVQYTAVLSQPGTYEVKEDFVCPNNYNPGPQDFPTTSSPFQVGPGLSVALSTDPTTVIVNQPVTISGTPNGGTAPLLVRLGPHQQWALHPCDAVKQLLDHHDLHDARRPHRKAADSGHGHFRERERAAHGRAVPQH
jgi:hypothetical protein